MVQKIQTLSSMTSTAAPPRKRSASGWTVPSLEIDLNAGHAKELRDVLARYMDAARRAGGSAGPPARSSSHGTAGGLNPPPRSASRLGHRASR